MSLPLSSLFLSLLFSLCFYLCFCLYLSLSLSHYQCSIIMYFSLISNDGEKSARTFFFISLSLRKSIFCRNTAVTAINRPRRHRSGESHAERIKMNSIINQARKKVVMNFIGQALALGSADKTHAR